MNRVLGAGSDWRDLDTEPFGARRKDRGGRESRKS
jgi:hypothetical protein